MKLSKVILISSFTFMVSCTGFYESKLKTQTGKLETLLTVIPSDEFGEVNESIFETNIDNVHTYNDLKQSLELCSVVRHSFGISFQFKCEESLERDPNYSDREYYLIKLFDINFKQSLQGLEYWSDCSSKIEELDKNWFYLRRHLRCD